VAKLLTKDEARRIAASIKPPLTVVGVKFFCTLPILGPAQQTYSTKFGNGGNGGAPDELFFTAGIPGPGNVEDHGLFGDLTVATPLTESC
jgi:hypothetical protein